MINSFKDVPHGTNAGIRVVLQSRFSFYFKHFHCYIKQSLVNHEMVTLFSYSYIYWIIIKPHFSPALIKITGIIF